MAPRAPALRPGRPGRIANGPGRINVSAPMSVDEFKGSTQGAPPAGLSGALLALWHDARGDWDAAHEAAQRAQTPQGAWVHAYLHRKEGDLANAAHWYRRSGRPPAAGALGAEWDQIAGELLGAGPLSRA